MQRQIESAQYVLVVCTETYKARLDKNEEPGTRLGAVWESQLIAAALRWTPRLRQPVNPLFAVR